MNRTTFFGSLAALFAAPPFLAAESQRPPAPPPPAPSHAQCVACKHFAILNSSSGECVRYPPVRINAAPFWAFPTMQNEQECGEFIYLAPPAQQERDRHWRLIRNILRDRPNRPGRP